VTGRAAATLLAAGVALVASGCGGGSTVSSSTGDSALAFAHCMRSNGVSAYPDPDGSGQLVKESLHQLGVTSARFQAAETACRHVLPNGGRTPSRAEQQRVAAQSLRFSQCVRAHGVPRFPDPAGDGRIPDPASVGIDQGSPKFESANRACAQYRPPYMPSNSAYNVWARTHATGS
jgi:hypothetical protein